VKYCRTPREKKERERERKSASQRAHIFSEGIKEEQVFLNYTTIRFIDSQFYQQIKNINIIYVSSILKTCIAVIHCIEHMREREREGYDSIIHVLRAQLREGANMIQD
jgi:hypothetical protein